MHAIMDTSNLTQLRLQKLAQYFHMWLGPFLGQKMIQYFFTWLEKQKTLTILNFSAYFILFYYFFLLSGQKQ